MLNSNTSTKAKSSSPSNYFNGIVSVYTDSKDLRMKKSNTNHTAITDHTSLLKSHKPQADKSLTSNFSNEIVNVEDDSKDLRMKKSKSINKITGITNHYATLKDHRSEANKSLPSSSNDIVDVEDDSKHVRKEKLKSIKTNTVITDYDALSKNQRPIANETKQPNFPNASSKENLNWIKGEVGKLEWNFDLITEEESNKRLLKFFGITSALLLLLATILLTKIFESSSFNSLQSTWYKEAPKSTQKSELFPKYHLDVLLKNGSVWDLTFNENFLLMKKQLILQLPKYENYFAFVTNSRVVNFVSDDLSAIFQSKIGQYENSFTKIKGSVSFEDHFEKYDGHRLYFRHGIQVGNRFWMLEGHWKGNFISFTKVYNIT